MQNFDKQCLQVFFKISANVYNYNTNNKKKNLTVNVQKKKTNKKQKYIIII